MSDEPDNIASRDWRLQAITTLAQDFQSPWTGNAYKAGTPVEITGFVRFGKDTLSIPVPSPVAVYLSLARKARDSGNEFFARKFRTRCMSLPNGTARLPPDNESEFFDGLESLIACIVFSYTAIEAFANEAIPDDFSFEREREDSRCKEVYSKEQIEQNLGLNVKLDQILPSIRSVSSPKGTKVWQDYIWLKELRDRLIHLKSTDWMRSDPQKADEYIWAQLLSEKVMQSPEFAVALINHYCVSEKPRWIRKLLTVLSRK